MADHASSPPPAEMQTPDDLAGQAQSALARLERVRAEIGRVVFGQDRVAELALTALLAGGHALLLGAPGLAKTRLASALAVIMGLDWSRIQFTPDLMPSDILGAEVLDEGADGRRQFRFVKGPIFTGLLMADEINRASPRTQSALLQAMQEGQATIAGQAYALPKPFHVLATQNPIEQEGTYPLPEAQLDRFLLQIDVGYPDREAERKILLETTGVTDYAPAAVLGQGELLGFQALVRRLPVAEKLLAAIVDLVRSARPDANAPAFVREHVAWGPSPRAGQTLMLAARARALLRGRLAPSLDDVAALAEPALAHRMALNYASLAEGHSAKSIVASLVERLG